MKTHLMPINLTEMKLTNTLKEINRQDSELKQISNATENFKSYFKKKKGKLYKELLTSCPHHFAHFTRAFYQMFKEEIILDSLFQKLEEGILPFYETTIKSYKDKVSHQYTSQKKVKIFTKILASQIQQHIRIIVYHNQMGNMLRIKSCSTLENQGNIPY